MKDEKLNLERMDRLLIGLVLLSCIWLLLWYWQASQKSMLEKKIHREEGKLNKILKLVKEKGELLLPEKQDSPTNLDGLAFEDLATLADKLVKEAQLEPWLIRIQPLQGLNKNSVRLVFQGVPLEGIVRFFQILEKKKLTFVQASQVMLQLLGGGMDKWRAIITLREEKSSS